MKNYHYEITNQGALDFKVYPFKINEVSKKLVVPTTLNPYNLALEIYCARADAGFSEAIGKVDKDVAVQGLAYECFKDLRYLEHIRLPQSIKYISDSAFYGCGALKSIKIPERIKIIEQWTFGRCRSLGSVTTPANLEKIETLAFYDCENLKKIQLPHTLQYIGAYAFQGCGLEQIVIPDKLEKLEKGAFMYCKHLKEVVLQEGLKKIESRVFDGCYNLKNIQIPPSVTFIDENAFFLNHRNSVKAKFIVENNSQAYKILQKQGFTNFGFTERESKQAPIHNTDNGFSL